MDLPGSTEERHDVPQDRVTGEESGATDGPAVVLSAL